ncbi:MAG: ABC transporter ATP-binding protein/permease [Treponema sp.]|nr:ABC transporter ATP-binding protein/permease [Treponema sp.]
MKTKQTHIGLPWKGGRLAMIAAAGADRRFRFFLCCAATLGTVGFSFLNPQIIRHTIDSVLGAVPLAAPGFVLALVERAGGVDALRANIWMPALLILGMALISALCNMVRRYTGLEIGETVAWRLQNTLYAHVQKLPYEWHVKSQTGDIIQRCTSDIDRTRFFIQEQLSELMRSVCVFAVAVAMMFYMDVFMSLMALSLIPLILLFSVMYFRRISREFAVAEEAESSMHTVAQENYTGVQVVRAFGREAHEMGRFSKATRDFRNTWVRIGGMLGTFWGAGDFITMVQLTVVVGAGILRTARGELTPGTFLAFYTYCNWMIWPVRQLGRILADFSQTLIASGRIRDILREEQEADPPDALTPEIKGKIRFDNVTFGYREGEPVLKGVSFTLNPGETMAILGATGSGKSTLVHLLLRLYDLKDDEGLITIDGIDIRRISRPWIRRQVGLCLQEPFLFSKTIRQNLAMASQDLELAELKGFAGVAMVDRTVEGLTDGYDTIIGERGVTLSGGQRQRIAIARMLAGKSPVMIFDDSLSAVDNETDASIRAALQRHARDATAIIISHRVSSLMQADKILVLKDGAVEDFGPHEELLAREGSYRRIFELQRGGEQA